MLDVFYSTGLQLTFLEASGGFSSVFSQPGPERPWGWCHLMAFGLCKHVDICQDVTAFCWKSNGWKYASVLIHCVIDIACWAKVNAQQPSHLSLNFSFLLRNFPLCSHGIFHHCCVCSVCFVLQMNLQFWVFTVNTASLMNGRSHAQHYSFSEEWLEELSKDKGSDARPISDLLLFWALPLTPLHLQNYCCLGILHELQRAAAEPSLVSEGKML